MNLLDILFPKRCLGCGRLGRYVCLNCQKIIRCIATSEAICPVCEKPAIDGATHPKCRTRYSLDGLTSFFHYDGVVRKAVKTLKYRFVSDFASEFVSLIPPSLFQLTINHKPSTILIPIPLHPSRLRQRGFNQAEILGRLVASKLRIPLYPDILTRTKKTIPQVDMKDKKERLKNMRNVFSIHNSQCMIHNSAVLLFDDVFTTGATMRVAANVLKRAGIKKVWAVTMAR